MIAAVRSQWLLLSRRPLLWGLAAVHLLLLAAQFILPVLVMRAATQLAEMQQGGADLLPPEAIEQLRVQALFPGALATAFSQINSVGGLLLMVFTGAFIGSDFNWGTTRTLLIRQPDRSRYLLSKLLALLPLAALTVFITLLLGVLLGVLNHALLGEPLNAAAIGVVDLLLGSLRSLFGLLPYMLLAAACAVAGRSVLAGVAGSLLFWSIEVGLGVFALIQSAGTIGRRIYNLTLSQNVGALTDLTRRSFGIRLEERAGPLELFFPAPLQAVLLLSLYMLIFLVAALFQLRRRDIGGPR